MKINRSVIVLVIVFLVIPMAFSVSSGIFGGIEGFECWCRGEDDKSTGAQTPAASVGSPVVDLGALPGPWNITSGGFPDSSARFIWNAAGALASAVPNTTPIVFLKTYSNPGSAVPVTLYVMVDDVADVFLNGSPVGSIVNCCVVKKMSANLQPGNNTLSIAAKNVGAANNPAGLLVTAVDSSGKVLFHSDSSWTFMNTTAV